MVKPLSYRGKNCQTNFINLKLGSTEINKDQKGDRKKKTRKRERKIISLV